MVTQAKILFGKVMHGRLFPKKNNFAYSIYYLCLPLSQIKSLPIAYNKFGLLSFYDHDHGERNGNDLESWARSILADHKIKKADGEIVLICMPRVLGYTFNPISFWLCYDKQKQLRAVLCEVQNTFGENHTYLCFHKNHHPISHKDVLKAKKVFHVSPFLKREGNYTFRFDMREGKFGAWINFYNGEGEKQLITSLIGTHETMTPQTLRKAFWRHPLITFKAISLIHWQALKLFSAGIKYITKPKQKNIRTSSTDEILEE